MIAKDPKKKLMDGLHGVHESYKIIYKILFWGVFYLRRGIAFIVKFSREYKLKKII